MIMAWIIPSFPTFSTSKWWNQIQNHPIMQPFGDKFTTSIEDGLLLGLPHELLPYDIKTPQKPW